MPEIDIEEVNKKLQAYALSVGHSLPVGMLNELQKLHDWVTTPIEDATLHAIIVTDDWEQKKEIALYGPVFSHEEAEDMGRRWAGAHPDLKFVVTPMVVMNETERAAEFLGVKKT